MAEELQSLLDRIQAEGVDKAKAEAARIVEEAERKAAEIVADAGRKAADLRAKAEEEARVLQARSEQSLRQAARDVVLEVGDNVRQTLERVLRKDVDAALADPAFLQKYVEGIVRAAASGDEGAAELHVAPEQAEALAAYARSRLAAEAEKGLRIAPDRDVTAGVRVMVRDGRVEHDFTDEAVMQALSRMIRPALAKIAFGK